MSYQLEASYTLLNAWEQGRFEEAINGYFKLQPIWNKAIEEGERYHKMWEEEVNLFKRVPHTFCKNKITGEITEIRLNDPVTEQFLEIELSNWLKLRLRYDCYHKLDERFYELIEFKTGVRDSNEYMRDKQTGLYAFGGRLQGMNFKKISLYHYNQHDRYADWSMAWVSDRMVRDAGEWFVRVSTDVHNYFLQHDLYNKYNEIREAGKQARESKISKIEQGE